MSGSSSDTFAALNKAFSQLEISQAALSELQQALYAYVERHNKGDEGSSARLQEELRKVHKNHLEANSSQLGPFMTTLKTLRPSINSDDISEWFKTAVWAFLDQPFSKKVFVQDAQDFVVEAMLYNQEAPDASQKAKVSGELVQQVVEEYMKRTKLLIEGDGAPSLRTQNQAQQRLQGILLAFGRKQPKDLFHVLDGFFLQRSTRFHTLQLLSAWLQQQQPHLDLVVHTPLIEHLLKCLMNDRSTLLVSVALQCLVMLLPHIPVTVSTQLPRLFLIYSRCLCWEKFSAASSQAQKDLVTDDRIRRGSDSESEQLFSIDLTWKVITSVPGASESSAPELLSYFTYLYGLYPLNFMSYIRKPRKYLKNVDFPGADNFDLDQSIIRSRTEQFQRAHLLHPSFFSTTVEEELADNRWLKAEPTEVVTECLALYAGSQMLPVASAPPPGDRLPALPSVASTTDVRSGASSPATAAFGSSSTVTDSAASTDASKMMPGSTPETASAIDDSSRAGAGTDAGFLQRELLLVRNELNFERYLKQQHSAAIGHLKRERIKAVTMEAETATLFNANRALQKKLGDAIKLNEKMQKETQARKIHSKQSEDQLTTKMRALRSGLADQTLLEASLKKATTDIEQLRQLLVESESRELQSQEELDDKLKEIEVLKAEVADLHEQMDLLKSQHSEISAAQEENDGLRRDVELSRAQVASRDHERERSKQVFHAKIADLESRLASAQSGLSGQPADVTDLNNRLYDAQQKQLSMKRAWMKSNQELQDLKLRYEELLASNSDLIDTAPLSTLPSHPLARSYGNGQSGTFLEHPGHSNLWQGPAVGQTYQPADPYALGRSLPSASSGFTGNGQSYPPNRPMRSDIHDQRQQNNSPMSRSEGYDGNSSPYLQAGWERSAMSANHSDAGSAYGVGSPAVRGGSQSAFSLGSDETSLRSEDKSKIKPKSEVRVYGRGGAQNIKMKDKDDKSGKTSGVGGLKAMFSSGS